MIIYTGRFQPFHNGHLSLIRRLCTSYPKEIICIAIIKDIPFLNKKDEFDKQTDIMLSKVRNPLSSDNALALVNRVVKKLPYNNIVVTLMPRASLESWGYITSLFDCDRTWVFTQNITSQDEWEDEKCHFYKSQGEKVIRIPIEKDIEGTIIRQAIKNHEYVKLATMVPAEVLEYIIEHNF